MIIIFGATGFIGQHLTNKCIESNFSVLAIGRNFKSSLFEHNLITKMKVSEFISLNEEELNVIYNDCKAFFYLAGNSVPSRYANCPEEEIEINIPMLMRISKNFANLARKNSVFIYSSSAGMIYASSNEIKNEDSILAPISSYGFTKQVSENVLEFNSRVYNLKYCILRISNPIGVWQNNPYQGVVASLIRAMKNDSAFILYGNGEQKRDFIDADELSEGMLEVVNHYNNNCNFESTIYNIGSGVSYSINEVIKIIENTSGKKIKINKVNARDIDLIDVNINCDKVYKDTKWKATRDLADILSDLISLG
ncbi:NAD-dependent epimerase/dehydratase family protein [Grimontia hollisae]|uniref:NAD-dependent epimerase/dehydratase family protein n=1 Tax=Grimontia hollisae TaxID=673 RepID=UPI00165D5633|nr:NAD-dependent epimerase/dehydratase family protein [Grimontia hollisae]